MPREKSPVSRSAFRTDRGASYALLGALWLAQAGDSVQQAAAGQINHSNTVVLQLRNEHVLVRRIEREMIDATVDRPERDLTLEFENSLAVLLGDPWAHSSRER